MAKRSPMMAFVMHFFDSVFCPTDGDPIICIPQMTIITTARIPATPMTTRTIPSRYAVSVTVVSPASGARSVYVDAANDSEGRMNTARKKRHTKRSTDDNSDIMINLRPTAQLFEGFMDN